MAVKKQTQFNTTVFLYANGRYAIVSIGSVVFIYMYFTCILHVLIKINRIDLLY